jgi:hypothetical protein
MPVSNMRIHLEFWGAGVAGLGAWPAAHDTAERQALVAGPLLPLREACNEIGLEFGVWGAGSRLGVMENIARKLNVCMLTSTTKVKVVGINKARKRTLWLRAFMPVSKL